MISLVRKLRSRTIEYLSPSISVRASVGNEDSKESEDEAEVSNKEERLSYNKEEPSREDGKEEETAKEFDYKPFDPDLAPMKLEDKITLPAKKQVFALSPGQYTQAKFFNFGTKESILLYNQIVELLPIKFEGDSSQIGIDTHNLQDLRT